jgi:hypothetical protein
MRGVEGKENSSSSSNSAPATTGDKTRALGGGHSSSRSSRSEPESVTWESVKWKDGSSYEGLIKDGNCHLRGVLRYANGDRYEGEYKDNKMDGLGVYVWKNGAVYRGEWQNSKMHGCGVKLIPRTKGDVVPQEGEWLEDGYLGDIMACSKFSSRKKAMDADFAAASARAFEVSRGTTPHHDLIGFCGCCV